MATFKDMEGASTTTGSRSGAQEECFMLGSMNDSLSSISVSGYDQTNETGQIRLQINEVSKLRSKTSSPFHVFGGLPWRLSAKTELSKRTNNTKFFSVYIDCDPESQSTLWSCDAVVEFHLLPVKPENDAFVRKFTNKFGFRSNNWGFPSFLEFSEVTDSEKGFVENDAVILQAYITIQKTVGIRKGPNFDFTNPAFALSDGILRIEDKPVYVNKSVSFVCLQYFLQYLALYSPYFNALFFQNFSERHRKEVVLKDVLFDEFKELLDVIYPSHKPVTLDNVDFLLVLGDQYQFEYVMLECEKFLISVNDIPLEQKLVYVDRYNFSQLQHACMCEFTGLTQFKQLRETPEFTTLSDVTKAALLERVLKLL